MMNDELKTIQQQQYFSKIYSQAEVDEMFKKIKQDLLKIADAGEYEDLRREVLIYFHNQK
jgi:hypothetical protein